MLATSHIHKVPDEILLEIFQVHVWQHDGSPRRLGRVCRRFYALVVSAGSLWGNILFSDIKYKQLPSMLNLHGLTRAQCQNSILCSSPAALARAVKRTKTSRFRFIAAFTHPELIPDIEWAPLSPTDFALRCYDMRFLSGQMPNFFRSLDSLPALKSLQIAYWTDSYRHLLEAVSKTSRQLRQLRCPMMFRPTVAYRNLAPRLKVLIFTGAHRDGDWDEMPKCATNLETLSLYSSVDRPKVVESDLWSPIPIEPGMVSTRNGRPFGTIRHLHIGMPYSYLSHQLHLELPNLQVLTVSTWWDVINCIVAPNLEVLRLYGFSHHFPSPKYQPKQLDIDIWRGEKDIIPFLELWDEIEALQIVYQQHDRSLWLPLTKALAGIAEKPAIIPNLSSLAIISPMRPRRRREDSEDRLKNIVEARDLGHPLKRTRYGWCSASTQRGGTREVPVQWTEIR